MKKATFYALCVLAAHSLTHATNATPNPDDFRDYENTQRESVQKFYRLNHTHQTVEFVLQKKKEYLGLNKKKMGIWQALEWLDTLIDDSDPDLDLSQINHALQTAEAMRADGQPDWLVVTGLIHDLGKMLCFFGEPQWAVVGDTFPVGCAYSNAIVFHEFFKHNPNIHNPTYQTKYGIYEPHCGLDNVHLSWGHDEYLYHVVKDYLPPEAVYIIRYHSFYAHHQKRAYDHLMNKYDHTMFPWIQLFNKYDLYSKQPTKPDHEKLKPYYQKLISDFFPAEISW